MSGQCQVDFYLLASASLKAERLACRLAMMAWERGHSISIVTGSEELARQVDELMWSFPDNRFLPHGQLGTSDADGAPVTIMASPPSGESDVVINLTQESMKSAPSYRRLLEIVPFDPAQRESSRDKFRNYRGMGLSPAKHDIS